VRKLDQRADQDGGTLIHRDPADEGLVQLDDVGGQMGDVAEVGEPGAEIIQRDVHASTTQALEFGHDDGVVAGEFALREFQLDRRRRRAMFTENVCHALGEAALAQVQRGYVDRHVQAQAAGAPLGRLFRCALQHPDGQFVDQRGVFRERNELRRRDRAEHRMVPADQRLGAGGAPGGQVVFRLEAQRQLIFRSEGGGQVGQQHEAASVRVIRAAVVPRPARAAEPAVLRRRQRVAQRVLAMGAGAIREPDAEPRHDRQAGAEQRCGAGRDDLADQGFGVGRADKGKAEDADMIELDDRRDAFAQPGRPGANEILRIIMSQSTQQRVEVRRVRQCHHHDLGAVRLRLCVIDQELLPVRQIGHRIEPREG